MPQVIKVGDVFGRWTVMTQLPRRGGHDMAQVQCECGLLTERRAVHLTSGASNSCRACSFRSRQKSYSPEYEAWLALVQRCTNPKNPRFHAYGGRGITVCAEWRASFDAFFAHVGPRPSSAYSIDRIDNDGNYEPGNCRWATRSQQQFNRRTVKPERRMTASTEGALV